MSEQVDDLVERLRSRAWEHRQHRQLREAAAAEITALRAENEVHRKSIGAYGIAQARAEAAEADAARYRWLRQWVTKPNDMPAMPEPETVEQFDAAIDAAMSERK
jgi:hypothetical protein